MARRLIGIVFDRALEELGGTDITIVRMIKLLGSSGFSFQILCAGEISPRISQNLDTQTLDKLHLLPKLNGLPQVIRNLILLPFFIVKAYKMTGEVDVVISINSYLSRFFPNRKWALYFLTVPMPRPPGGGIMQQIFHRMNLFLYRPSGNHVVVAHSRRAGEQVWETFHVTAPHVLYPPVPGAFFYREFSKKPYIAHLARFSQDKGHDLAVLAFEEVSKQRRDAKLYLIGSVRSGKTRRKTLAGLRQLISATGLRNVGIFTDVGERFLIDLLKICRVILSFQVSPESFNIAILEGMAAGCIPVLPRVETGGWDEITNRGEYGFGFCGIKDCAKVVLQLLRLSDSEVARLCKKASNRAHHFDEGRFVERLITILKICGLSMRDHRVRHT